MTLRTEEGRRPKQPSWWAARQIKGPAHTRGMFLKAPDYWGITAGRLDSSVRPSWGVSFDTNMQRRMKNPVVWISQAEQTYADEFRKAWKLAGKLSQPPLHLRLLCTCSRKQDACECDVRVSFLLLARLFVWFVSWYISDSGGCTRADVSGNEQVGQGCPITAGVSVGGK